MAVAVIAATASMASAVDIAFFFTSPQAQVAANLPLDTSWAGGLQANVVPPQSPTIPPPFNNPLMHANVPLAYVEPAAQGSATAFLNYAGQGTVGLNLWMNVADKYPGFAESVSSVGLKMEYPVSPGGGLNGPTPNASLNRRGYVNAALTLFTLQTDTNAVGGALWDGTNIVGPVTPGTSIADARAVTVADSLADISNGAPPSLVGAGPGVVGTDLAGTVNSSVSYRVARAVFTGSGVGGIPMCRPTATKAILPTRYNLFLSTDNVLITKQADPAASPSGSSSVAFGYSGGAPEGASGGPNACTVANSGSCVGAITTTPDAAVEVRIKGDMDGNGVMNATDNGLFNTVLGAPAGQSPQAKWLADINNDGVVNATDNGLFSGRLAAWTTQIILCP